MNINKCPLRVGDMVCLKSGSKPMTVIDINNIDGFELTVAKELKDWNISFIQLPISAVNLYVIPEKNA